MRIGKGAVFILGIVALTLTAGFGTTFGATPVTFTSTDVPVATVDAGTVTSTTTVPNIGAISDINVQVDITHDCDGILDIYLIAPDGTRVELATTLTGCGSGFAGTIFDDEAPTAITAGTSPFAGSYQPEGLLSALDTTATEGTWTLEVTDTDALGHTGSINEWSLIFETSNTYPSAGVPVATADNTTVTSTTTVPCLGTVTDINVQLDITHTWLSALNIYLIAPDGTRVELSTGNGGAGGSYTGTTFDDEAATSITAGTSPFAGSYQPEGILSDLDGIPTGGTWTLEVTDTDGFGDTGSLDSWSLIIESTPDGTTTCNVQKPITDNTITWSTMEVLDTVRIGDINVQIDITHTWVGDLDIYLIAPNGTRVELTTGNGGDGDNFSGTIFDDEAPTSITSVVNTDAPFTGSYRPEGPLSGLNEIQVNGLWTLEIHDTTPGDEGTLDSWSLMITQSYSAPQPITDLTVTLCTLEIFDTIRIGDINVEVDITHTRVSDLDIFLIAPDGTRVELSTGNGGDGDDFTGTIFDDQAPTSITSIINTDAPFTGSYKPEGLLSTLNSKQANGLWTLEIYDSAAGDEGTLNSWNLIIKKPRIVRMIIPAILNWNRK